MIIRYSKKALKFLSGLDRKSVERIRDGIAQLTRKPSQGDIKPLQGYKPERYRLRVGAWRVIFRYEINDETKILYILNVGNRGDIYK